VQRKRFFFSFYFSFFNCFAFLFFAFFVRFIKMGSAASAAMTAAVNGEDVGDAMAKELEAQANAAVEMAAAELELAVTEGQESAFISEFISFFSFLSLFIVISCL
jgi:hypothetical protein